MAAPPPLLRGLPLLRLRFRLHHRIIAAGAVAQVRRPICSSFAASESTRSDSDVIGHAAGELLRMRDPPKIFDKIDEPDYRKWKDMEEEILRVIEPIIISTKDILHSDRYMDGERLLPDDEKFVMDNLLAHHPHFEYKIGCGLDSIMVDRHPQFRHSRCLFVVRMDGGWIDFSYQKCLCEYIRNKYPLYAERFIREHFKRSRR